MLDVYGQLKSLYDEIFKRRMNDSTCGQGNALSNSNHDSGIQANLSCNDEINFIICDIRELVRNVEFMVSIAVPRGEWQTKLSCPSNASLVMSSATNAPS